MGKIIAVVNQKGGVGKTTTAVNLSAALSMLGNFVLLVDLDPQANATQSIGIDHRQLPHGLYEAISGSKRVSEVIFNTSHDGFRIIPSTPSLAGANVELVSEEERETKLLKVLQEVKPLYDYVIIDCPPSLGLLTLNGLVAADEVLIPVQSEYFALEGLGQLVATIDLIKENLKPELDIMGIVITMFDQRNKLSQDVMQELYKVFPSKVYRSVIPRTVRLAEAPSFGKTIFHYEPEGRGAHAYARLAREIIFGE